MAKKFSQRAEDLRRALAQEAARIMAEHGIADFLQAKRKAADRLGVNDVAVLPANNIGGTGFPGGVAALKA